jgi:hypothetical protein
VSEPYRRFGNDTPTLGHRRDGGDGVTDLHTLRAKLRTDLHDGDEGDRRWQDEVLDRHILRALRELSEVWPAEARSVIQTNPGSREIDLSGLEGLVRVEAVEHPTGRWPPSYVHFSVWGTTLTLLIDTPPTAGEDVAIYWGRLHTLDTEGSSLPPTAEDIVLLGASAYAALELASFASNRANVAGPEAVRQYRDWGESRLRQFRERLQRLGRNARLRGRRLYVAGDDPAGPR